MWPSRDKDNFPVPEPEKPFAPDQVTNEKFRGKLDRLKRGDVVLNYSLLINPVCRFLYRVSTIDPLHIIH